MGCRVLRGLRRPTLRPAQVPTTPPPHLYTNPGISHRSIVTGGRIGRAAVLFCCFGGADPCSNPPTGSAGIEPCIR